MRRFLIGVLLFLLLGCENLVSVAAAETVQNPTDRRAQPVPPAALLAHFPSPAHAAVWRNWRAVEPARIAEVLGTSEEIVLAMADSMGLPPAASIPREQKSRGYFWMTLCRRNWHLLPIEQLATLVGGSPEELMDFLRVEEAANWTILGGFKPDCAPVRYEPPTVPVQNRVRRFREIVQQQFADQLARPGEPRFAFVARLSQPRSKPLDTEHRPNRASAPRFLCSYLKIYGDPLMDPQIDMYPEGLLERLAELGIEGIWLYGVLRELAPGGATFPEFGAGHETRQANLRTLVDRAKRYGMGVYLYINEPRAMTPEFFQNRPELRGVGNGLCTSHPAVRQWISDALAHLFTHVPGLAGVFTITASENQTNCAWAGRHDLCPRCKDRTGAEILAEVNAAIEQGVHRGNPNAKVIVWDWGWQLVKDEADVIRRLPKNVWLMSVSEWSSPIQRGGVPSEVGEYSLSVVGPGPRAVGHWELARQMGLKTVAKVQLNTSWELASLPYLPVMDLVAQHCKNLAEARVDGMMLTWSLGGYPSPNLKIAQHFHRKPSSTVDEVLELVARDHFGPDGAPFARKAWSTFSRAFQEYPYSSSVLYNSPAQLGAANLVFSTRTGWAATMVGYPYDDLGQWCPPYPPEVFAEQFEKLSEGWKPGLEQLRQAVEKAPGDRRPAGHEQLQYARAAWLTFRSVANQTRFVLARDLVARGDLPPDSRRQQIQTLQRTLLDEMEVAREMYHLASGNSCIGFEAASQYFYLPLDFVEKAVSCQLLLEQFQLRAGN